MGKQSCAAEVVSSRVVEKDAEDARAMALKCLRRPTCTFIMNVTGLAGAYLLLAQPGREFD